MWSLINVSSNLHTVDVHLNTSIIFASFLSEGTIPSSWDKVAYSFLKQLGDLLSFTLLIFFAIISGVTINCPK